MRITIVRAALLLGIVATPAMASAQHLSRDPLPNWAIPPLIQPNAKLPITGTIPSMGLPGLPLPSIGLPLPSIGLPLSSIGGPRQPAGTHGRGDGRQRGNGWNRNRNQWNTGFSGFVFLTPPWIIAEPPLYAEPAPAAVPERKGNLILQVQPSRTQVFVDGYYEGIADDFDGNPRPLVLDTGAHIIELDEPGYETVRFDVRIDADRSIAYRRELTPIVAAAPAAPITSKPTPMYSIPGCYLGNVPPKDAGLPATCDPARAIRLN